MKRTPMELAALASAAMPGLDIVGVASTGEQSPEFDNALVTDRDNTIWRVRSPRTDQAGMRLETELEVLSGFTPTIRAKLPFRVPSVAGAVQLDRRRTFVYHQIPGEELDLDTIVCLPDIVRDDLGRITAAIHELPRSVVEIADLPVYTAEEHRTRRLNELDQVALTGKIPSILLRRWENALEETQMWGFTPTVVHGDLHEEHLLFDRGRAVGLIGWTDLHIGDPAVDFSWLASVEDPVFGEQIIDAYYRYLGAAADDRDFHLMRRASLSAEFALAQWLMRGINSHDQRMIDDAVSMLDDLAADVAETGGQDVGSELSKPHHSSVAAPDETNPAHSTAKADDGTSAERVQQVNEPEEVTAPISTINANLNAEDGAVVTDADVDADDDDATENENPVRDDPKASEASPPEADNADDGDQVDDDAGVVTEPVSLDAIRQMKEDRESDSASQAEDSSSRN